MRHLLMCSLLMASLAQGESTSNLKPFASDGCSAFPDGLITVKDLWLACCVAHDKAYWQGGTRVERRAADDQLRRCVADVGEPEIARLMLAGVRVGGTPYLPTRFRWGYGWPYPRGYKAVSEAEQLELEERQMSREPRE